MINLRSIEFLDLLLKHKENAARRVAVLYLGSEWVRKKILLCAFFVHFQGIVEDYLKVVGLVGGRCGCSVSVGHNGEKQGVCSRQEEGQRVRGNGEQTPPREFEYTCHPGRSITATVAEGRAIKNREGGNSELTRKLFMEQVTFGLSLRLAFLIFFSKSR
jgi:hypothetical protein